jgi:hypothetical protein
MMRKSERVTWQACIRLRIAGSAATLIPLIRPDPGLLSGSHPPMIKPLLFTPITIREITFRNRVIIAPMATY